MDESTFAPIEVTLTREEYAASLVRAGRLARRTIRWPLPARLIGYVRVLVPPILIVAGLIAFHPAAANDLKAGLFLVLLIASFCFFAWLRQSHYLLRMLPRDDGSILRAHTITIDGGGLSTQSEFISTHVRWPAIKSIDDHAGLILIFLDRASAMTIPRRAFPDGETADRFIATVLSRSTLGTGQTTDTRSRFAKWVSRIVIGSVAALIVYHLARWIAAGG